MIKMKKGCFLKSIIILTILIAAVLYLVEHNYKDLIVNPGKGILKGIALKEVNKRFDNVKETPEKDSLEQLINNFVESKINKIAIEKDKSKEDGNNVNINIDDEFDTKMDKLMDSLNVYLKDNIVDQTDLQKVIDILKEYNNEGSKKNRN
jgi:hypothetical protein